MKVRCIDAKEIGIPLEEGKTYTVCYSFKEVPEWGGKPVAGYVLEEVEGRFRKDRFEVVK